MKSFEKQSDIKSVQISISSPQEIQARSNGEVLNSKSLNYKTMNPEKGGLFCEIIFGPMKEYECRCGALQGLEYAGKKCNLCGVEVNSSRLRRYRMGHINLVVPIPHVWFLKIRPFYLNTLIGLKLRQLDQILLAKNEVVLNVKQKKIELFLKDNITNSNSEINQVIDVSKTVEKKRSRIRTIRGSGSEVLYHYLTSLDLSQEYLVQRQLLLENVSFQNFNQISADLLDTFDYNLSNSNTSISLLSKSNRGTVNPLNFHIFLRSQSFLLQLKRLKILEYFLCNKRRPEWMMLKVLPILPPELRPFLIMENNLVVSSDLNLLYKRIVERSHRLKAIYKLGTPLALQLTTTTFICNELAMLQHAVDSLIDNGRRGKAMLNKKRIPLKSLTHILKGKEGRFRMNLLGKRVDLSARTVISVGPRLKLTQCGLPISIALVLFKSLIYKKINPYSSIGLKYKASNVVNSKYRFKESSMNNYTNSSRLLAQIDELVYFNPLLLNRAPTLHRLNVQPFQPIMINNKAIQLHPLVCSSFNADFDGDQMAVHLPLSLSSQIEARILMMTYNNIISIANGSVIIMPSQDIVFGLYYATMTYSNNVYEHHFYSIKEVQNALLEKIISLHTPIKLWVNSQNNKKQFYITTPGRVLLYSLLPVNSNYKEGIQNVISFERINKIFNKKGIHDLIQHIYYHSTKEQFLYFLDHLMAYGFYNAHRAAISLSVQDVVIPSIKNRLIQRAKQSYKDYTLHLFEQNNLNSNNLTGNVSDSLPNSYKQEQLKKRMVSSWSDAQSRITSLIVKDVNESQNKDKPPIYMLIHSGARGSILQMRQLSGLRGLMVKPSGDLIEMPISSNFREGLRVVEYFYSTHGARKGVIDTSIRTATSGYLTRRLVHATQDLIITEEDCGTIRGIPIVSEFSNGKEIRSLINLALGRTVSHNVYEPTSNKLIFGRNSMITWVDSEKLKHIEKIYVRSPLVCESKEGVCKLCYGSNLSNGKLISLGEAIGILASQSIGEPGTQLTMRTFHMGGVLLGESSTSTIRSGSRGRVYLKYGLCLPLRFDNLTEFNDLKFMNHGQEIDLNISLSSFFEIVIVSEDYHITNRYQVPYGSVLFCKDGSFVEKGDLLYKTNANYEPIIYKDIKEGYLIYKGAYSSQNSSILETVSQNHNIISKKEVKIQRIIIQNQKGDLLDTSKEIKKGIVKQLTHVYYLQDKDLLIKQNKTRVSLGSILFLIPRNAQGRGDITGGLSKISQLFESSLPFKERILAKRKGIAFAYPYDTLKNRKEGKGSSWKITLFGEKLSNESTLVTYNTAMRIRSYSFIKKGESLAFENPSLLEVLQVYGVATAIYKLKKDVISIYLENGVSIHDKHIELVLRRMFNRVQILDRGSTSYMVREEVDNNEFIKENILALSKGLFMAKASLVTRGVTYISLESKSFLSAASFQNTAQVLSSAALQGKIDHLKGLSENVILGRLIPVGSGTIIQ